MWETAWKKGTTALRKEIERILCLLSYLHIAVWKQQAYWNIFISVDWET